MKKTAHTANKNYTPKPFAFSKEDTASLYAALCRGQELAGFDAEALYYYGTRISFGELLETIDAFAAGLLKEGVKKGDAVTIYLPNIPQCIAAVYAVNRIGAVCNFVHPLLAGNELEYAVSLTESRFILAYEGNEGHCRGLGAKIIRCRLATFFPKGPKGAVMKMIVNHTGRNNVPADTAVEWTDILANGKAALASGENLPAPGKEDDVAAVMYTGGTTGNPKGVLLTNKAMNANSITLLNELFHGRTAKPKTAFLGVLPVFHAFGFGVVIHLPLAGGMRLILVPQFNPKSCASLILREKIYGIVGVPAMFEKMYPYLRDKDLSFVGIIGSGGDLVSHELIARYNRILPNAVFRLGYGLTEVSGCCLFTAEDDANLPQGCLGKVLGKAEICLVEPGTTNVIPDSEDGEFCMRSASVMKGYYKNEKETKMVLRRHPDGKVWLHTGDIVTIDKDRNVIFRSRCKRMIKVNGFNVYPSVIEDILSSCPVINEVCAVGIPWEESERVKLYVTLNSPDMNEDEAKEEIKKYAFEHLNRWSCPKQIRIIAEMPRTKMNKVDYQAFDLDKDERWGADEMIENNV